MFERKKSHHVPIDPEKDPSRRLDSPCDCPMCKKESEPKNLKEKAIKDLEESKEKLMDYDNDLMKLVKRLVHDKELTSDENLRWFGKVF